MARFFRDSPKNGHNIPVVSGRCLWNCQGTLVTGYCLFQLRLQSLYIWQSFIEFFLIWAAAAQLEYGISCRMYDLCGDFQQFKTDSVDTLFFHIGGQWKSPEPVEKVVGKRMHLKAVCIHHHRMWTCGPSDHTASQPWRLLFWDETSCRPDTWIRRTLQRNQSDFRWLHDTVRHRQEPHSLSVQGSASDRWIIQV